MPMKSEALGVFGRASLGLRFAPRRLTVKTQNWTIRCSPWRWRWRWRAPSERSLRFEYQAEPPSQGAGDSDRIPTGTVSRWAASPARPFRAGG